MNASMETAEQTQNTSKSQHHNG